MIKIKKPAFCAALVVAAFVATSLVNYSLTSQRESDSTSIGNNSNKKKSRNVMVEKISMVPSSQPTYLHNALIYEGILENMSKESVLAKVNEKDFDKALLLEKLKNRDIDKEDVIEKLNNAGIVLQDETISSFLEEEIELSTPPPKIKYDNYEDLPENFMDNVHLHVLAGGGPENTSCGGCMLLNELQLAVEDLGVSTSGYGTFNSLPDVTCPEDEDLKAIGVEDRVLVFVYPEVDDRICEGIGNRVHVRWILAPLGSNAGLNEAINWGEEDLVFHHTANDAFDPIHLPETNILQVITSPKPGDATDFETFPSTENRTGILWYKGKAEDYDFDFTRHEGHGIEVTEMEERIDPDEFVELIQNYEYFFCYDAYSFYIYLAGMSGTVTVVNPFFGLTEMQWILGSYTGEYTRAVGEVLPGIAWDWDEDEIEYARRTMPELRPYMERLRSWAHDVTVPRMVRDAYRYGMGERVNFEGAIYVRDAFPLKKDIMTSYRFNGDELKDGIEMKEDALDVLSNLGDRK